MEIPAPPYWKTNTSRKQDIGEQIEIKRQLEKYLKSDVGGPPISKFDCSIGSPRRSARLSGILKSAEVSESEPPKKEQKTSDRKGKKKIDAAGESKGSLEISVEDAKSVGDTDVVDSTPPQMPIVTKVEKYTKIEELLEKPPAVECQPTENPKAEIQTGVDSVDASVKGLKTEPCLKFFSYLKCPLKEDDCPKLHNVTGGLIALKEMLGFNPALAHIKIVPGRRLFGLPEFPWERHRQQKVDPSPWKQFPFKKEASPKYSTLMWNSEGGWLFPCKVFPWDHKDAFTPLGRTASESSNVKETDQTISSVEEFALTGKLHGPLTKLCYFITPISSNRRIVEDDFQEDLSFEHSSLTKIPSPLADDVFGFKGINFKQLSKLTGAKLLLQDHNDSDPNWRIVEFRGSLRQVERANELFVDMINNIVVASRRPSKKIIKFGVDPITEVTLF